MAISPEHLKQFIAETLSPQTEVRKNAENNLAMAQKSPGFTSEVLKLVASSDGGVSETVRQSAAVLFKNTIKKGWKADDAQENGIVIHEQERNAIKTHAVQLMCTTPPLIQVQISESISLIAAQDYPENWKTLLPDLISRLHNTDQEVVNGVLKTLNAIFKRFRYVQRDDELYAIILFSLKGKPEWGINEGIQEPLLSLLKQTSTAIQALQSSPLQLVPRFETLRLICRITYSLVYQDLPEYFEDHMEEWMAEFEKFLQPSIFSFLNDPDDDDEPGPLDKVQAAIIAILSHFANKDEEVFIERHLAKFMQLVWNLLVNITTLPKHDVLASTSIKFLTSLVSKNMHHGLFGDPETLTQIVTKIVIPNLKFRETDEERFQDDPREFMVTEVEGSDSETRRKCAQDCLKALCRNFEPTTNICVQHIQSMIAEDANGAAWKSKDAAINLLMGVAIRAETHKGVSQLNPAVNLMDFFSSQVLPELQDANHTNRPVVKAASIKFVATFRNQFTRDQLVQLMPLLIKHLSSPVIVVHTFAAYAIERILVCKDENNQPKIKKSDLMPLLEPLFTGLFSIVENPRWNENDYVIKCVCKTLATIGNDVLPVTEIVIKKLTEALGRIASNPRNPQFNHYLFESLAVLIQNVCSQDASATTAFEAMLFPPFNTVLQMQVTEFMPYVFQILSQLLEYRPAEMGLGDSYQQLFQPLLTADLWSGGKIPALARLIQAYLQQSAPTLVVHIVPILGIFQKLLSIRSTEEHSFIVLNAAVTYFPQDAMKQYIPQVFQLLFMRLQKKGPADKFRGHIINFFAVFVGRYGPEMFASILNGIQPNMVPMVVKQVWAAQILTSPPSQKTQAKIQVVGLTRLLCDSAVLLTAGDAGPPAWAAGIVAAVKLISSPTFKDSGVVANLADDEQIETSFESQFSQLQFAKRPVDDPFPQVTDAVADFCQSFNRLSTQHAGQFGPLIQQAFGDDEKLTAVFSSLVQNNQLTLS